MPFSLIDRERFTERMMGPEGSYDAQVFELPAEPMLKMVAQYPLDGTTTFHNRRLWQVLGTASFGNREGIVLRYYSEPRSAIQVLSDHDRCLQVVERIALDEFEKIAGNLFAATENTAPSVKGFGGEIKLDSQVVPDSLGILPPRVGYVMLLMDNSSGTPVICDLVNVVAREPLSCSITHAYQREWTLVRPSGKAHPGLEKKLTTFFGPVPVGIGEFTVMGSYEDLRFREGAVVQPPSKFGNRSDNRAIRLYEIAYAVRFAPTETAAKVQQFKADFPGDTGADMAIVIVSMIQDRIRIIPESAEQVSQSAASLYEVYHDPFLLAVQGLAESARDRHDQAREKLRAAHQTGFESVATHEFFLVDALRRDDTEGLKTALADLASFWGNHNATRNDQVYNKYAARWRQYEESLKPREPSLAERMAGARRPAGESGMNPGPRGGRIGPSAQGSRSQEPSGEQANAGSRQAASGSPPQSHSRTGRSLGTEQADPNAKVTIKLTIHGRFDINESVKRLREKLQFSGHNASSRDNTGTIVINYPVAVKDVAGAIDFGKVTSIDERQRVISVTTE
jgi:hypothetical protein